MRATGQKMRAESNTIAGHRLNCGPYCAQNHKKYACSVMTQKRKDFLFVCYFTLLSTKNIVVGGLSVGF